MVEPFLCQVGQIWLQQAGLVAREKQISQILRKSNEIKSTNI